MRNNTIALVVCCVMVTLGLLLSYVFVPVAAKVVEEEDAVLIAPEAPTVVPTPGTCVKWMMAGDQAIYKCVDGEAPWATCYQPQGGVLQCVVE